MSWRIIVVVVILAIGQCIVAAGLRMAELPFDGFGRPTGPVAIPCDPAGVIAGGHGG